MEDSWCVEITLPCKNVHTGGCATPWSFGSHGLNQNVNDVRFTY